MLIEFKEMTEKFANIIISKEFSGNFECYNLEHEPEEIDDLIDKEGYDFFASFIEDELIGFVECYFEDNILEIGLGLLPEYINQGLGTDFVSQTVEFLVEYYDYEEDVIRSYISPEDKKTIDVMKRVGFNVVDTTDKWSELEIVV